AEATALILPGEWHVRRSCNMANERLNFVRMLEHSQMASEVEGDLAAELRANINDLELIDQEVTELKRSLCKVERSLVPLAFMLQQMRILDFRHRRARPARDYHRLIPFKYADRVFRLFPR